MTHEEYIQLTRKAWNAGREARGLAPMSNDEDGGVAWNAVLAAATELKKELWQE